MTISGDLLTAATPTRLSCLRGSWVLEVVKLVSVDRDVYQPRTQRIEGVDAILQYLKRTADTAGLASAAAALTRGRADQECSFEAVDSEWVPCEPGPQRGSSRPSSPVAALNNGHNVVLAELRAELCLMRAAHDGLRQRVARLETQLSSAGPIRDVSTSGLGQASFAPAISEVPQPALWTPAAHARPATLASHLPTADETGASLAATEAHEPALNLPSPAAVASCLQTLLGKKVGVREVRSTFSPRSAGPFWFSRLVDDEGREVGVVIADLQATVTLGGALMMVPPNELDAQRASKTPSEDVLSAMEEVANNLSATINQQDGAAHVRVRPLEPMIAGSLEWTRGSVRSVALELSDDMGQLFIFSR